MRWENTRGEATRRESTRREGTAAAHEPRTEATDPATSDAAPTDTTPRDAAPAGTTHVDTTHVDTTHADTPASEEAPTDTDARRRRPGRAGRRPVVGRLLSALLLFVVVAGLAAQFVTLPFVILEPGPAFDILGKSQNGVPVVTVVGGKTYPTSGSLYFTTVSQYGGPGRRPSAWDVGVAMFDPHAELLRESVVYPPQVTREQVRDENAAAMTDSQQEAVAVALRELGRPVTEKAVVADVVPDSPATGVVNKGDAVTAVNGTKIVHAPEITQLIQKSTGPVRLTVTRDGTSRDLTLTPTVRENRRVVGVLVHPSFTFGVDVVINAGEVGGPSAGMMFGLGVYDTLTPGALTAVQRIAGTGTLDSEGDVGPIGGIAQKMQGAKESGAGYFLAPKENCGEVLGHVPNGLVVTPVSTFDQALNAVETIAAGKANTLPSCPAG